MASLALRASRVIRPCSDGLAAIRSSGRFGASAPILAARSPLDGAANHQVRHASKNPEFDAPYVKNIHKQNEPWPVKPKTDWRGRRIPTPDDLPERWMWFGLIFVLLLGTRVISILTGGDKQEEPFCQPRPGPGAKAE